LSVALATLSIMLTDLPEPLRELAQMQRGILTRSQARGGGLSRDAIEWRLRTGRWQRLHTGVYAAFTGEPTRIATLWAAVLRAGSGAILSYHTAAELYHLARQASPLIHVTIPDRRRIGKIAGVIVHVSARAELTRHPTLTPPRTTVEETVLDLVQQAATAENAYAWLTSALGRRLTTQPRMTDALSLRPRTRWRLELTMGLTADWAAVHSVLEHRYVRDVERRHGLPNSRRQARVRRGTRNEYRDVLYEGYDVAVELDGRAAHPGDTRWNDIRRDNAAAADGVLTLRYGWTDISQRPCLVASQVAQALRQRGRISAHACSAGCQGSWPAG
jgi:very-short-patch-repair endonuclease